MMGVTLVSLVVRVMGDLLMLPVSFPESLAFLFAAILLVFYPGVGKKKPAALGVGTSDLSAHGPPSRRKTITLFRKPFAGKE
jgi:hypothetical protein